MRIFTQPSAVGDAVIRITDRGDIPPYDKGHAYEGRGQSGCVRFK